MKRLAIAAFLLLGLAGCSSGRGPDAPGTDAMEAFSDPAGETAGDEPGTDQAPDTAGTDAPDAAGDADAPLPSCDEPAARVRFDLLGSPIDSPFPGNHYLDPQTGTITINANGFDNSALYLVETDLPTYAEDAARSRGFALYSILAFLTSTEVDPATLPTTGEASLAPGAGVKLYRISAGTLVEQAIHCGFRRFDDDPVFHLVQCRPLFKLAPDTSYLFVVTDGLKDVDGNVMQKSCGFRQALGLARVEGDPPAQRLARMHRTGDEIAAALAMLPSAEHVASASVFTTGHPQTRIEELMSLFRKGAPTQPVDYLLDTDGEGQAIVYPGHELSACAMDDEAMEWGLMGTFHAPEFRNADGHFQQDETGAFRTFASEDIRFYLMVPAGDGPFPVVIAQHGVASSYTALCDVSRELVRRDIAVLSFTWPEHGARGNGMTDFIDVFNPGRMAFNFMQAAAELASSVLLLDQLNADMASLRPEGDGLPPLDTSRIGYVGHSLGAIVGLLYLPFSDRIDVLVSNVGGVGMSHLVERFIDQYFPGLYMGSAAANLTDHIVCIGDGVSNAEKILKEPVAWASGPKYVLAQEVIGDEVVSNPSTEALARNAGMSLVQPVAVPIEGVPAAEPAGLTSGVFQFTGTGHHEFPGAPGDPVPDAERMQAWHYLETGLRNGVPEIRVFPPASPPSR